MRIRGRPSWRLTIDEPEGLHLVLFVRDCYRLPAGEAGQPGALTPAGPDLSGSLAEPARRAAAAAWPAWWQSAAGNHRAASRPLPHGASTAEHLRQARQLAGDGPEFSSLSHAPALREAARAAFGPFQQWWAPPLIPGPGDPPSRAGPSGLSGARGHLVDLHLGRDTDHDVIAQIERDLGREASPFDFRIDILAVTQPPVVMQDERQAVISGGLVASETRYREWLYAAIRPIA